MDKAVVLAAGAGSRMRQNDTSATLSAEQSAVAATGVKALIPFGRPFLDYVLDNVADAGYRRVCLVIGPRHDALRNRYEDIGSTRLSIEFAVQQEPNGTADAVLSAESFTDADEFLVINSDNLYPADILRQLREAPGPATAAFDLAGLGTDRENTLKSAARFAILAPDKHGFLSRIIEKPAPDAIDSWCGPLRVSMNCWRFSPKIFTACRRIERSSRGEFELPDAVMVSLRQLGERYRMIPSSERVLDLSRRVDVDDVARILRDVEVRL